MKNVTEVRRWLVILDTGRAVTEEMRLVHPGPRGVLWDAQVKMHFDSASENSCCPYGTGYFRRNCLFSWRRSYFVIREWLARNVIGLGQAR